MFMCPNEAFDCPYYQADGSCSLENATQECDDAAAANEEEEEEKE